MGLCEDWEESKLELLLFFNLRSQAVVWGTDITTTAQHTGLPSARGGSEAIQGQVQPERKLIAIYTHMLLNIKLAGGIITISLSASQAGYISEMTS